MSKIGTNIEENDKINSNHTTFSKMIGNMNKLTETINKGGAPDRN